MNQRKCSNFHSADGVVLNVREESMSNAAKRTALFFFHNIYSSDLTDIVNKWLCC